MVISRGLAVAPELLVKGAQTVGSVLAILSHDSRGELPTPKGLALAACVLIFPDFLRVCGSCSHLRVCPGDAKR